jgi:hypothetical protein
LLGRIIGSSLTPFAPLPHEQVLFLSLLSPPVTSPVELTDGRGGGRGQGAKLYYPDRSRPSIKSFNIYWIGVFITVNIYYRIYLKTIGAYREITDLIL